MPKQSKKKEIVNYLKKSAIQRVLISQIVDTVDASFEEADEDDEVLWDLTLSLAIVENLRYTVPMVLNSVPKSQNFLLKVSPNLDENRFRELVRINWSTFQAILNLIKDDEAFRGPRSCKQLPIAVQLMIVLYRLGSYGEGASISKIARLFGIGDGGTIQRITLRVFKSILRLKNRFLFWPDAQERNQLVLETLHELPHCIGYVDGSEIKLAERPQQDPEAYFSRKHIYPLKVQATCDYKVRIRHIVVGYPGSVHDSRIFNNCELSKHQSEYFNGAQWIVGDSAYKLTTTVITPFRTNSNEATLQDRNNFNSRLRKYRVRIEHCFGRLKERFNSLKELKIQIKDDLSVKYACGWILVCGILHNIILEQNGNDDLFESPDFSTEDETENQDDFATNQLHPINNNSEGELRRRALMEIIRNNN